MSDLRSDSAEFLGLTLGFLAGRLALEADNIKSFTLRNLDEKTIILDSTVQ